jgi:selenocysteine-specific elongation factor
VRTIGGGYILNPIPQKHKRYKPEVVKGLKSLMDNEPEEIISYYLDESGYQGVSFSDLLIMTNIHEKQLHDIMQGLLSKRTVILTDKENQIYIHHNSFDKLKKEMSVCLDNYHQVNPLKAGMPKEELRSKFPSLRNSKLTNLMLNHMIKDKKIVAEENTVRLASHTISLGMDQADIREKILDAYLNSGLTPPYFKELSKSLDVEISRAKDVLMLLVDEGLIVKVKEDLYFNSLAVEDLQQKLVDFLVSHGEITTPQFKNMTGVSRKYLIPLIEHFDAKNVTIRIGDSRKLRKRN